MNVMLLAECVRSCLAGAAAKTGQAIEGIWGRFGGVNGCGGWMMRGVGKLEGFERWELPFMYGCASECGRELVVVVIGEAVEG
jgi:hypothetical protein